MAWGAALGTLLLMAPPATAGEDRLVVEGLAEAEGWNTGPDTELFSRDDGGNAPLGRLRLWSTAALAPGLEGFALGALEGGPAADGGETDARLEQAYLRYTFAGPRLAIQAGKLSLPYGNFSQRYLSSVNPLIGAPLNYVISYAYGAQVNGQVGHFDYMAAILATPLTRQSYLAGASTAPRPALAAGFTPVVGLRLGAYATQGEYLGSEDDPAMPAGTSRSDFDERVLGFDLRFSRGHFELNGEYTTTRLEAPGLPDSDSNGAYLEPKLTLSPRWFAAMRLEQGRVTEVWPETTIPWWLSELRYRDVEIGAGFRVDHRLVAKASFRSEVGLDESAYPNYGGHAFAVQISYQFDVTGWLSRPR